MDLEDWLWTHLPHWLASFISGIHDMLPFTKRVWSDDEDGFDR